MQVPGFGQVLAQWVSFQIDLVGVVHEPLHDRVGERRLAKPFMPVLDGELAQ